MMTTAPNTFVIRLPEMWSELPVEAEALKEYAAEALKSATDDEQVDEFTQRRFLLLIDRIASQAEEGGVVFAAGYIEAVAADATETDDASGEPVVIMATAALTTRAAEALGTRSSRLTSSAPRSSPTPSTAAASVFGSPNWLTFHRDERSAMSC